MCYENAEEITLTWDQWRELFPHGVPFIYTDGKPWIDLSSLKGKRGKERKSMLEEITRNAQNVLLEDLSRKRPNFSLLDALKNNETHRRQ